MIKALKIIGCTDRMMWYRDHIGMCVPLLKVGHTEYLSKEPEGYVNIVKKTDAIVVDVPSEDVLYV